ncbi:MAG: Ribonuclease P protein component [Parcubacteria group bacterium GW2011_GWA1_47_11]|nr:MAG: Ribonuclease P protein component [Parcubacteria group bacterium GW2011_GWA1_47_11]
MLPKTRKLSIKDFPKKSTLCFRGERISIKVAPSERDYPRLGVMVSKKVSSKATVRNSLKRTIYDFLGKNLEKIPRGSDLLVIVSGHIIEVNSDVKDALCKELEKGLKAL